MTFDKEMCFTDELYLKIILNILVVVGKKFSFRFALQELRWIFTIIEYGGDGKIYNSGLFQELSRYFQLVLYDTKMNKVPGSDLIVFS